MENLLVIRHNKTDTLFSAETLLKQQGLSIQYLDAWNDRFNTPASLEETIGVVMLGGAVGVSTINPKEYAFIETILKADIPFIGVCLGAQILSEILGGRIYPNPQIEIGWISLEVLENTPSDHPIRSLGGNKTKVLSWHQDTCDVPQGAKLLASTHVCKNQVFQYSNALGLQFHIEVPSNPFASWFLHRKEELKKYIINESIFVKETENNMSRYHECVQSFFHDWISSLKRDNLHP